MRIKKPSTKKRLSARSKVKVSVDPSRLALAALERIKSVLSRTNHPERFGAATTMRDLAARANVAGRPLPPSYVAAMRVTSSIGEPEEFLAAAEMERVMREVVALPAGVDKHRYLPFAAGPNGKTYYCFDQHQKTPMPLPEAVRMPRGDDAELAIVEWHAGVVKPLASHFGEWLDIVADEREETLEHAAEIPKSLRDLLVHLGFRFEDPVVGRIVTGDIVAVETLLGDERAEKVRGEANRLFDSTGRAQLTLNLDEFALTVTLRTGSMVFEAEEVFRWLRTFRDENFFGESYREPSHPDQVRDLRKAPREPPLIVRGTLEVTAMPAKKHFFADASGPSPQDFHLLGRSLGDRSTSLILHVVKGEVRGAHTFEQALHGIHAEASGVIWGLSNHGNVVRFENGAHRSFPLPRASGSLTWWYGIGEYRGRILVWGTGALLEFDGKGFVPFRPDAKLEKHEAVLAVGIAGPTAAKTDLSMLVCGDRVGAVARFDGRDWVPITEAQVVDGDLADYDVWRGVGILLGRAGEVWRVENGAPRTVIWDNGEPAFINDAGVPRPMHAVRGFDGGALLATDGGIIAVGGNEPVFHTTRGAREPVRLARIGSDAPSTPVAGDSAEPKSAIVATFGPNVWIWTAGNLQVFDMRAW